MPDAERRPTRRDALNAGALATGTCIGHKRIERFEAVEAAKVRLRIAPPIIRKLAAYHVG
ncbi:MAG: hypothetical protein ISS72_06725 [Candidatus Brocadiae bacterium]|nr:hypothetical protein [Candidatus Brocadiia bacterium]